jgi:enoyl-CoA hydratase/carnithine racemase
MAGRIDVAPCGADGIVRVTISHPGKLNALSVAMWRGLRQAFNALAGADGSRERVVIVCGEGGAFAAGGDIEEFPQFRFEETSLRAFHEEAVAPALQAVLDCPLPVVAQIEGPCVGGGLEIAACCDIRIAGASSRFGIPIAKLGFPLAPLEAQMVSRVLPLPLLRELLLEARLMEAPEALARGVVSRVVPDDEVAHEAARSAQRMAQLSPQAARLNKITLRQLAEGGPTTAQRVAHYAYADSAEHREGLAAFLEKRPARFAP